VRLGELAERLACELVGDSELQVERVAPIETAQPGDLSFATSRKYAQQIAHTRASALIVAPGVDTPTPRLVTPNPYLAYARAVALLHPAPPAPPGVHPSAQVDPSAELGAGVHVGALVVIGPHVRVGARTLLHPHVTLYRDVEIGADCVLHSGVQVREDCRLGERVIVQNGAVIGGDGFGFAKDDAGRYHKIPQIGRVVIEDDVEIGALTAIDRAALGETRIGRGSKLDNLVQIGHSVTIGHDTVMAGQVGVAGSTRIGSNVTLAGQVGVAGHVTLGDGVIATAQTGIPHSIDAGALVSGFPAIDNRAWLKSSAVFARLPELQKRVRELETQLAALTQAGMAPKE
jgi:UDP-3-O-[3-hydroxymyristoyl] glucosamine N-acyltransferase